MLAAKCETSEEIKTYFWVSPSQRCYHLSLWGQRSEYSSYAHWCMK